jgi:hypothetical protein
MMQTLHFGAACRIADRTSNSERTEPVMAGHERINNPAHLERFWPLDPGVSLDGCPDCDLAIAHFLRGLELDMRFISLDLWTSGWTPQELIDEIRRSTGFVDAAALIAQLLLVDDSHRSDQARPPAWRDEIDALRSRSGVTDLGAGWLTAWMVEQSSARQASECLKAVVTALNDLVRPRWCDELRVV